MPGDPAALLSKIDGIKGAVILKKDGTVVASTLPGGTDAKELAKRAIGIMESSSLYSENAGGSQVNYAIAGGADGLVAVAQNGGFLLVCVTGPESDVDSVAAKVKKAAEGLRELA
ncbi:MAG: roadblock/LC7 domain-containing protein [Candidatus Micrarchaeota archaeon]